ncbi:MAG TPA: ATP-binding cassette domain-containing protein, partial [Chloroflexota bacterium]|nr:ATP-binding cassette domain-containing protein [Chloroflexota bacterium]
MGFLMGVVGVLETARLGSATANIGTTLSLDALTAVLLGGVSFLGGSGHPLGIVLGVLTIGVINAGLIFAELADWYQNIAKGSLLLLALAADQFAVYRRARSLSSAGTAEAAPLTPGWTGDGPATLTLEAEAFRAGTVPRDAPVVFACESLSKSYGALKAVQDVGFTVRAGEVVCLVGDNGAGKSTVVKMISGAIQPDRGTVLVDGRQVEQMRSIMDGRRAGIQCVFQDLAVCSNLGIAHNLILGDEPRRRALGLIPVRDDVEAVRRAKERLARLGIYLEDFGRPVRWLSGGQRQSVAVARVLKTGARLVVLDEPTAALGINQTRNVLAMVRTVADEGAGVILITHDIETVFTVGDRAVVLRQGRKVHDGPLSRLRKTDLVHLMAGFALAGAQE